VSIVDIAVKCVRGAGDKEAPEIQDELIATEHLAVLRGKAFLDQAYYNRTTRRIRLPYAAVTDGQIVRIAAPAIADGNYHLTGVEITIEGPVKAMMTVDAEGEYVDP
jgi:hypothetical protein